ncbi:SufD family Fe-S cluster assembly protein [Candidatus Oleimmundimicrobium sp.]|uniref:SufB/SufD family protein n=1 Tax=Candidatus Oleimmundimicrobium sp. TaxID=3060597 RepID=UPI002717D1FE|nr:SufD family Fe-S cluster assembly protein [Candidatus Oleimmundimicrobium sp.]MDO8886838.1 SufD family Fe-S cluster assembly protein [Candidatus Oleimmundimicrobium sp.]
MQEKTLPYEILESAKKVGFDVDSMMSPSTPKLFLNFNKVAALKDVPGLILKSKELDNGIVADIIVTKGAKIKQPLHLCFGMVSQSGVQEVISRFIIEDGAEILILAHCSFPNARNLVHKMEAEIAIGKGAKFFYEERHYHGENSGASVYPAFEAEVGEGSYFKTIFSLVKGTAGKVNINANIYAQRDAKVEMITKAYGKSNRDKVMIRDALFLEGRNSRGTIRMRAAARGGGEVFMEGITEGNAPGATGHVDCKEIIQGFGSTARATPLVRVTDEMARITHEASVGRVNQKELDTLMARGLNEEEAVDMIVKGML